MKINKFLLKTGFVFLLLSAACSLVSAQDIKVRKVKIIISDYGEVTTKTITGNRNMKLYEQGGNFDCREYVLTKERGQCDMNKFRDFIWQKWLEKKHAYIRMTGNSVDAGGTSHYFIEPDEKGSWSITCRLVRWSVLPPGRSEMVEFSKIYQVERVENKDVKGSWKLTFKDKNGTFVFED